MRKCPVDDFTLSQASYEGVTIDQCPHCSGVWLDAGELETVQNAQASDFRDVPTESAIEDVKAAEAMGRAAEETPRGCVVCNAGLEQKEYAYASQVMIDQCPKGHGMWLDKNELARLEMFFEDEEDLDKILTSLEDKEAGKGFGGILIKLWGALRGEQGSS